MRAYIKISWRNLIMILQIYTLLYMKLKQNLLSSLKRRIEKGIVLLN
jgi:hypothetical protein